MASIDKRNDGWRVRWRDPDGTARSRQLPTKRAATQLQKEVDECTALGRRWDAKRGESHRAPVALGGSYGLVTLVKRRISGSS